MDREIIEDSKRRWRTIRKRPKCRKRYVSTIDAILSILNASSQMQNISGFTLFQVNSPTMDLEERSATAKTWTHVKDEDTKT